MFERLLWRDGSAVVCRRGGALGVGMAYVLPEEVAIHPRTELPEPTQDWGIDAWRAQQNRVHQNPGERSSDPTGHWVSGSLQRRGRSAVASAGLGAQTAATHAWDLLREVPILFIASTIV